jgi:formylglycine-generating enzyme required for sulfatase activity
MKTRISKLIRFLSILILILAVCALAPRALAQPRPSLGLQFSGGQPTLSLTGAVGMVYSIQYATDLPPTNVWVDRTLVQAKGGGTVWADPSSPTPGQRFYRAVSVPAPADTNLVFIQPGTFTMGSPTNEVDRRYTEGPQTLVTITRGFWIGKHEVTQGEYTAVMGSNPSWFSGDANRPVEQVAWSDATNYLARLTQRERSAGLIATNALYRLPTEAEWEYACRAGSSTRFSYGDDPGYTNLTDYAWYGNNSAGTTHPAGLKLPNPWGLYDMYGNVWEWCHDWYDGSVGYPGGVAVDPQGAAAGSFRAIRGSAFDDYAMNCRSAMRNNYLPFNPNRYIGFRVVLAPGQ